MLPLRGALVTLSLACALGAGLLLVSGSYKRERLDRYRTQVQQLETLKREQAEALDAWRIFNRHLSRYAELVDRGFVGPEARLEWIEALRLAARAATAFAVDYQIDRQVEATDLTAGQNRFEVHRSDMRVRLPLLHEGRLLAVLDALENSKSGLAELRGCTLTPSYKDRPVAGAANVQAECTLSWYTLGRAAGQDDGT